MKDDAPYFDSQSRNPSKTYSTVQVMVFSLVYQWQNKIVGQENEFKIILVHQLQHNKVVGKRSQYEIIVIHQLQYYKVVGSENQLKVILADYQQ